MDIANLLKARRINLGISQTKLAQALGIHKSNLCRRESGQWQWSFEDVLKACEILELDLTIKSK
jgi:transcriptional regulator with XRE-family HTH domain